MSVTNEYKRILNKTFSNLLRVESYINHQLKNINTLKEAEKLAELYHSKSFVEHLLNCIAEGDVPEQIYRFRREDSHLKERK